MNSLNNALTIVLLASTAVIPVDATAKNNLMPAKTYEQNKELFNGWTSDEIHQMPQDTFGDTGPVIDQFDGISSDPNWVNENE